ncbi:MAG: hypothetical protein K6E94_07295 [Elusimicrobiaceae bacterium]|nr:hypothetical protein [Elusimicrobiaceae bacterium]
MKHYLLILFVCAVMCACSSSQKADDGYYSYSKDGVLEEEFDLLVAPKMDYEKDVPYEEQIKNANQKSTKTTTATKTNKKPTAKKVN